MDQDPALVKGAAADLDRLTLAWRRRVRSLSRERRQQDQEL